MIDRLRLAVRRMILAAHPADVTAVWAPSTFPRSPGADRAIITAQCVRGPTLAQSERRRMTLPTSLLVTIASPTDNARMGLRLSGVQRYADLGAGETATSARDALLDVLTEPLDAEALLPGVTVAGVGADSIRLTGAPGTMYEPEAIGPGLTYATESSVRARCLTGRAQAVLEVTAYAGGRAPIAQELLSGVETALRAPTVDAIEQDTGVIFGRHSLGDIVDLTALAGPEWESRAVARIAVSLRAMRAEEIETINTLSMSRLRTSAPGGTDAGPDAFSVSDPT